MKKRNTRNKFGAKILNNKKMRAEKKQISARKFIYT